MKKIVMAVSGVSLFFFSCASAPVSKTDGALLGALGGAAVGAATHKHYKASAKDAAIYGAVAGGILGYVFGNDRKSTHTVNSDSEYDVKTKDGKIIHVHENWYTVDSEPAPKGR